MKKNIVVVMLAGVLVSSLGEINMVKASEIKPVLISSKIIKNKKLKYEAFRNEVFTVTLPSEYKNFLKVEKDSTSENRVLISYVNDNKEIIIGTVYPVKKGLRSGVQGSRIVKSDKEYDYYGIILEANRADDKYQEILKYIKENMETIINPHSQVVDKEKNDYNFVPGKVKMQTVKKLKNEIYSIEIPEIYDELIDVREDNTSKNRIGFYYTPKKLNLTDLQKKELERENHYNYKSLNEDRVDEINNLSENERQREIETMKYKQEENGSSKKISKQEEILIATVYPVKKGLRSGVRGSKIVKSDKEYDYYALIVEENKVNQEQNLEYREIFEYIKENFDTIIKPNKEEYTFVPGQVKKEEYTFVPGQVKKEEYTFVPGQVKKEFIATSKDLGIKNTNNVYVQLRLAAESNGYEVSWDNIKKEVIITSKNGEKIYLSYKTSEYTINNETKKLKEKVVNVNNSTYIEMNVFLEMLRDIK